MTHKKLRSKENPIFSYASDKMSKALEEYREQKGLRKEFFNVVEENHEKDKKVLAQYEQNFESTIKKAREQMNKFHDDPKKNSSSINL